MLMVVEDQLIIDRVGVVVLFWKSSQIVHLQILKKKFQKGNVNVDPSKLREVTDKVSKKGNVNVDPSKLRSY